MSPLAVLFGFRISFGIRISDFGFQEVTLEGIQFRSRPNTLIAFKNHTTALHANRRLTCQGNRFQSFPAIEDPNRRGYADKNGTCRTSNARGEYPP